jgi:hypothetical protein
VELRYHLTGTEDGAANLRWLASGHTAGGTSLSAEASHAVRVGGSPLKVKVAPRPAEFSLGELDGNEFEVDVVLRNDSEDEIRNVTLVGGDGSPFFMMNLREVPGVALEVRELDTDYQVGDMAPHGTVTLTYKLRAFDVVHARLTAIALYGDSQGHPLQSNGEAEVKVLSDVMVEVDLKVTHSPDGPGKPMVITGTIKNVTDDKVIGVGAFPIVSGNAANGILRQVGHPPGLPTEVQGWKLDAKASIDVDGTVRTMFAPVASDANVSYVFAAWILEENGDRTKLDSTQIKVNREDGSGDAFSVRIPPGEPEDDNPYDDCGFDEWYCGVVVGVDNFAAGTLDLAKMVGEGWLTGWTYQWRLMQWTGDMMATAAEALRGNPEAQQALIDEIVLDIGALANTGVITYDQGVELAPIVGNALGDVVGDVIEVQQTGNLEQLQFELGKFAGENPDLLVEGIFGLARKMAGRKLVTIAANPESYLASAMNHLDDARKAEVDDLMRRVEQTGEDVTSLLRAGDHLTPEAVLRLWGLNEHDLRLLQEIVENENIVIALRSRSPRAAELIENFLAYQKPELMKIKSVDEIDVGYLGYRPGTEGIVELVEPGPGLRDFTVDDFKRANIDSGSDIATQINAAVEAEYRRVTDGLDLETDLKARILNRIRQRAEEWPVYSGFTDYWAEHGIDVGYKTGLNGDAGLKLAVTDRRGLTKTLVERPDGGPRTWEIKMQGRGTGAEFKPIAGDVDITAIFGRDGRPITDPAKRERIYRKLIEAIGMRHGESFTFEGPGRAGYLAGKPQVVLQKGEPPRVGEYKPRQSLTADSPNASRRTSSEADDFVLLTGVKYELQAHEIWTEMVYRSLSSLLWDFTQARLILFYGRAAWDKVVMDLRDSQVSGTLDRENGSQFQPDGLGGIREWVSASSTTSPVEGRELLQAPGAWLPVTLENALARGAGQIVLAPQTTLWSDAASGATVLEVTSAEYLEFDAGSDWFQPGDIVVIDPGGPNEEYAEVSALGSLVLARPLERAHAQGEIVLLVVESTAPALACEDLVLAGFEDQAIDGVASCAGGAPALEFNAVSRPAHGQLTVTTDGQVRYVPLPDYFGIDTATIEVSSDAGALAQFSATWSVAPVNDAPICQPLALPALAGTTVTGTPSCSDADGDSLELSISAAPAMGTAAVVGATLSFAAPATPGAYDFWFVASDDKAESLPARVTSIVSAPTANASLSVAAAVVTPASGWWPSSLVMVGALRPAGGAKLRCGDDVAFSVNGWTERVPGSRFLRLGSTCIYLRPRNVEGYLLEFGFNTNTGAWSAVGTGWNPSFKDLPGRVSVGASVGSVSGSVDIDMIWRRQAWTLAR